MIWNLLQIYTSQQEYRKSLYKNHDNPQKFLFLGNDFFLKGGGNLLILPKNIVPALLSKTSLDSDFPQKLEVSRN